MGQWNSVALATLALLAFSFVFGGASRDHELRLALIELSALPLLVLAVSRLARGEPGRPTPLALGLVLAACALPLVQLIPLPPAIWSHLPGRAQLVLALDLAGVAQHWNSLSLTPDRTWRSFLALLPPVAMFLGALACPREIRLKLLRLVLFGTAAALVLGTLQMLSGGDQLYPWETTDAGNFVGFFANRNHMATLCLVSLPFAVVFGSRILRTGSRHDQPAFWLASIYVLAVVVALGVIRSRTGVALLAPVLGGSVIAAWVASGRGRPRWPLIATVAGASLLVIVLAVFAIGPVLERFDSTGAREGRFENWPVIAAAADTYLPLGSGIGSFDSVFRSVEPLERLQAAFFNQAHNDYLETWLEMGWPGAALIITFLVWFVRRSWTAWKGEVSTEGDLQRAASLAIAVVLLHASVDYPLRTETLAVTFALLCAVLESGALAAVGGGRGSSRTRSRRVRVVPGRDAPA